MNYQEAFIKTIDLHGLDVLNDTFMVRSFVSDYIGNSFNDKRLLDAYTLLNRNSLIYKTIKDQPLDESKVFIKSLIVKATSIYSPLEYIRSVEPLLMKLFANYKCVRVNKAVNKPVSPIHKKTKPVVNNVQLPKPAFNEKKAIKNVCVSSDSYNLVFDFYKGKDIKILKNDQDVTNSCKNLKNKDTLEIKAIGKRDYFRIKLPKKLYDCIDVQFVGSILTFSKAEGHAAKTLNIVSLKSDTYIHSAYKNISIRQKKGSIYIYSNADTLSISSEDSDVYLSLYNVNNSDYKVCLKKGIIRLRLYGERIKPKINHLFKRIKKIDDVYRIKNGTIKLSMITHHGNIRVD